jgi:hypothetical protein
MDELYDRLPTDVQSLVDEEIHLAQLSGEALRAFRNNHSYLPRRKNTRSCRLLRYDVRRSAWACCLYRRVHLALSKEDKNNFAATLSAYSVAASIWGMTGHKADLLSTMREISTSSG